ncbi:MAG: phosphoenolpyruvate--protein phosphotransferase [Sphaerobacter sp.]|nr:phosphoenolpyruvate--protein phosphotransferase [Sphaerobacter sp.]
MAERRMRGTPAAPGVAVGRIVRYTPARAAVRTADLAPTEVEQEVERLQRAVAQVRERVTQARERARGMAGASEAAIFDAQLLMLEDPALIGEAERRIREQRQPAARAIDETAAALRQQFAQLEDAYLRARAADVQDLATQILRVLAGGDGAGPTEFPENTIIVAEELFPSDTALFDPGRVVALVTERGSPTAHVAILARALEMPAIVGVAGALAQAQDGEGAIVDGDWGELILSPETATVSDYQGRVDAARQERARLRALQAVPAETMDNVRITLLANIGTPREAEIALTHGAEGVGLFRTEFLFLDRPEPPSEEEQYAAYRQVATLMAHRPVVIRTLDVGGDKPLPGVRMEREDNPFLGTRGLRLSLRYLDLFRTQIRAILRAAAHGNVWMMFPMVATVQDILDARQVVEDVQAELNAQGIPYGAEMPIGIMVETPAAAVAADVLIREVDFFSIGTNDLVQYTLAVDRTNPNLAQRYDPLDVSVVRLIAQTAAAANGLGKAVAVCGELAGDPEAIPLLIGLGIRELSMTASNIPRAKEIVRSLRVADAEQQAQQRMLGGLRD